MSKDCASNLDFYLKSYEIVRAMKVLPTPTMALTTFALEEQNNGCT